jgi:hypothetical protein
VVFYDNNTALPFSEDFLMPGRLLIDAKTAFRKTAARVASYLDTRPVSHVRKALPFRLALSSQ